ncbi:MAG: serine protease [Bdellovibrionota bacterium]
MRRYFFFIGLFLPTISAQASSQEVQDDDRDQWNALVEQVRPAVVKLDVANSIGLDNDFPFSGAATGVIVDKEEGLIVTNRHVVSKSPLNKLSINFYNSKSVNGNVFYIDPWHDFAFVKFDPSEVDFELTQATLGSIEDISLKEQLMLLGYVSGAENSYKYGHVNASCQSW